MRPVHHSAFVVVDVFSAQTNEVALVQRHARGHGDVVRDKHRGAVAETQQEPLVRQSRGVIGKALLDKGAGGHLDVPAVVCLSGKKLGITYLLSRQKRTLRLFCRVAGAQTSKRYDQCCGCSIEWFKLFQCAGLHVQPICCGQLSSIQKSGNV